MMIDQPIIDCSNLFLRLACFTSRHDVKKWFKTSLHQVLRNLRGVDIFQMAICNEKDTRWKFQLLEIYGQTCKSSPIYNSIILCPYMHMSYNGGNYFLMVRICEHMCNLLDNLFNAFINEDYFHDCLFTNTKFH